MTDKLDFLEGDKKAGKDSSQGPKKVSNKKGWVVAFQLCTLQSYISSWQVEFFFFFTLNTKMFTVILAAPMPRESTRTRNSALEARRAGRSGTPRRASTMYPVSAPKWLTQRAGKEGRKAKEENKMWVTHTQNADWLIYWIHKCRKCVKGNYKVTRKTVEKLIFLYFVPLVFQKRPGKSVRKKMKSRS